MANRRDLNDSLDVPDLKSGKRCCVTRVRVPLVSCYVLHLLDSNANPSDDEIGEMLSLALDLGHQLGLAKYGNRDAFTIIHNGKSVTRSRGVHVHIACLNSRWRKAWFYFVLALKNWLHPIHRVFDRSDRGKHNQ